MRQLLRKCYAPTLTSDEAGWSSVGIDYYHLPLAGETPKLCFDYYSIAVTLVQSFQCDWQMEGVAKEKVQRQMLFHGAMTLVPMHHVHWGVWNQPHEGFAIRLQPKWLTRNAIELLDVDQVELLPQKPLYDPLILQIGLALKADLESQRPGGRLYAETMATALAVHLLRNYSAHSHKSIRYLGGLSPTQLNLVVEYINDYLDQELSLQELAAIDLCYKSLRAGEVVERTGTFLWEDKIVPLKRHFKFSLVFLINIMKVGDRVRVTQSTTIYHHPAHKGQGFDLKGQEGEIIAIITEWQGRPVSANFPVQVKFPEKLRAHFREDELELI